MSQADADRRKIGVIGPLPGSGLLSHATTYAHNSLGLVSLTQQGSDTQSDTSGSSFTVLEQDAVAYDSLGRKIRTAG